MLALSVCNDFGFYPTNPVPFPSGRFCKVISEFFMKLNSTEVERLVNDHYEKLYRFALSLAGNEAEAADLTQQTYFTLAVKGGQLRDLAKAKSWLFTTLYREFLKLRRHTTRYTDIESGQFSDAEIFTVDANAARRADASMVMNALGRVREVFRVPVALYYIDDLNYREIAEVLDVPIGTVMSRLSRGREELRSELANDLRIENSACNVIPIQRASSA